MGNLIMRYSFKAAAIAGIALSVGLANTAMAFEPGDWLIRAGYTHVDPKSDNHAIVSVDGAGSLGLNFTYMMTDIWAIEVLAAYPFEHDIALIGGPKVGSTKHLPPTVSVQYHFRPTESFQPYWGIGVNYTNFFSEETTGALEGTNLSLGDSWGLAGQLGFDVMLNDSWFLNLDARYIQIDSKAKLDGANLGTVEIDPWVYSATIGYRF
jgi:outer membrane protein